MTPPAVAEKAISQMPPQGRIELDPLTPRVFRMFDAAFGEDHWRVNEDPRYCGNLLIHPIDVIVPVEEQDRMLSVIIALQAELSETLNINVFFNLTSPE